MSNSSLENAYAYAAQLQSNAARPPLRRYIRRSELRQIVPLGDTSIYKMEQRNEFPRRIVLMPRVVWSATRKLVQELRENSRFRA